MAGLMLDTVKELVTENADEMRKPEATVTHVSLKDVNLEFVTYNAEVSVSNPYSIPVPILEISYILKSGNREIASGTTSDPGGSLKANNTIVLDVELKVRHSMLLSLVRDIAADWDIDYELGINFVMNVHIDYELVINCVFDVPVFGNITIPIWNEGQIKVPTLSDLSILMKVRLLLLLGTSTVIFCSKVCLNVFDKLQKHFFKTK